FCVAMNNTQDPIEKIWATAQASLRSMLNSDLYNLWFSPIRAVSLEEDAVVLEVANEFCEFWLKDNYVGLIQDVLMQAAGRPLQVKFRVGSIDPATVSTRKSRPTVGEEPRRSGNEAPVLAFNPKNTFETFVVGTNNRFAHAASLAVA